MSKVGFAILTWNSVEYIDKCIKSITGNPYFEYEISILDNHSEDGTTEYLKSLKDSHIRVQFADSNLGICVGRNKASQALPVCDYICFLDSDTELTDYDGFKEALSYLQDNPDVGILGPTLINDDGSVQYSGRNFPSKKEKFLKVIPFKSVQAKAAKLEHVNYDDASDVFPVGYVLGACMIMRRDVYSDLGLFDEKIFYGPDDADYGALAWESDLKVVYFRKCTVKHLWQRISHRKLFSKHNLEHIKGLRYFFKKHKNLKSLRQTVNQAYSSVSKQ